jgi:hypothetical protein
MPGSYLNVIPNGQQTAGSTPSFGLFISMLDLLRKLMQYSLSVCEPSLLGFGGRLYLI